MNFEDRIRRDWQGNELVGSVCLSLLNALRSHAILDHYTFNQLKEWASTDNAQVVAVAVLYLSNPTLDLLRKSIMYEEDGALTELPDQELLHYERGEDVVHPRSGAKLRPSELLLAFEPGDSLRRAAG